MASPVTPVALNGTQDTTIKATSRAYHGFSVRETSGSASAVFRIRAGSNSGRILDTISLTANESRAEWYPAGILADGGIYEDWVSGAYEGTVRVGDDG